MTVVLAPEPVPAGLLEAFWAYDRALLANDLDALAALFAPGDDTLRADASGILVGHHAITAFRSGRTAVPTRSVARVHVRPMAPGVVTTIAETLGDAGTRGLQTQVWRCVEGRWRVCAAHVTQPGPGRAFDPSIWRVVGSPLVAGAPSGPLSGCSVAVKDLFAVRGHPIGAGNPTWLAGAAVSPEHAAVVAAVVEAGADVAGIARTDEFAYSLAGTNAHHGTPPNPAAPDRISGGSSSGPASAVAAGQVDIGLGTDTGGSVRVPASYQGLFGLRTTHGAVPRVGMLPLAPSFDTVGWLTRDAAMLERVTTTLLATATRAPLRRGVVVPAVLDRVDATVRAAFDEAVAGLALDRVDTVSLAPEVLAAWGAAFRTVQGHEAWGVDGAWVAAHPGALGPDVASRFATAAEVSDEEAAAARVVVAEARATLRAILEPGVALLLPATSSPAPSRAAEPGDPVIEAARAATLGLTCLAGLAGAPAVSMPLMTVDGAPVGLSAIAAPGADLDLVRWASPS
ncbi:MAG TPA: amidase [Mycobacteriales bacterium]